MPELREEFMEKHRHENEMLEDEVMKSIEVKNNFDENNLGPLITSSNRDIEMIGFIGAVLLIIVLGAIYL